MLKSASLITKCTRASLRAAVYRRGFHSSLFRQDASPFGMPAMSPTMEEGGIVSWKVKEGDAFSSGDILLEVETDKATIDVEALDDGILAKILKHDGDKGIKVGSPIAFIAEPGDNLADLTFPEVESGSAKSAETTTPPPPASAATPKAEPKAEPKETKSTSTPTVSGGKANPSQKLFPSVEILLHTHNISKEDALAKITATGPNGRILKGDVLAYLGTISKDANASIASYIDSKSHLDLSNIELRQAPAADSSAKDGKSAPSKPAKPAPIVVSEEFVLSKPVPADLLNSIISKASKKAEVYAYGTPTYAPSDLVDPLFEELIAPPKNADRFTAKVEVLSSSVRTPSKSVDFFDDFDFEPYEDKTAPAVLPIIKVNLTLTKVSDSKKRAELYIKYFGDYLAKVESKL